MMTTEEALKSLILSRYKSIREFCFAVDMPYTTIDNILKRGVENAGIGRIIKICKHLGISTDALAEGKIVMVSSFAPPGGEKLSDEEYLFLKKYRALDERGKEIVNTVIDSQYNVLYSPVENTDDKVG